MGGRTITSIKDLPENFAERAVAGAAVSADNKPPLRVLLCSPRGFCAGVVRAIDSVKRAIDIFGPPVYVRHQIVHNPFVVESLKAEGAIFVESLDQIPAGEAPVVFSAHGVSKSVSEDAKRRGLVALDAACPLVTKVHREVTLHYRRGRHVLLIGHRGHPEVLGTLGQLPPGAITLIETLADAAAFIPRHGAQLAYVTQTTLSVDDAAAMVGHLRERFPTIIGPSRDDICYATTNRQEAVKRVAPQVDAMIVVGAPNSSNSKRLREVAERVGCRHATLVQRADDINWAEFAAVRKLGITAGASTPEVLINEIMSAFAERYELSVEIVSAADEDTFFPLPRLLRSNEAVK
jgi:4-hydroxy-3-methylbut-2-enyl diphosphate reductase